ncbi:MAG: molybdenum cofactor biosynthesis protein MoaE [Sphingobacterium sp.]
MENRITNIFTEGAIPAQMITDAILRHESKTGVGAHALFLGQIRADPIDNKPVLAIQYTANMDLAMLQMEAISESVSSKYALDSILVYHSLGSVSVGEICFFVFVSSERRKAAISACEEVVERVKKELPIWGKELYADSTYTWKKNY